MVPLAIGFAWYTRDTYDKCLAIFEDAADLPDTYDEWLALAEQAAESCGGRGQAVVKALIDPDTFVEWCAANGERPNKDGRIAFANIAARDEILKARG